MRSIDVVCEVAAPNPTAGASMPASTRTINCGQGLSLPFQPMEQLFLNTFHSTMIQKKTPETR